MKEKEKNKPNKSKSCPEKRKVSKESHIQRTFEKQGQDLGLLGLFENSIFEKKTKATPLREPPNITNRPKKYTPISTLPTKTDEKKKANISNANF